MAVSENRRRSCAHNFMTGTNLLHVTPLCHAALFITMEIKQLKRSEKVTSCNYAQALKGFFFSVFLLSTCQNVHYDPVFHL